MSRARAEELGAELRQLNVTAFVTHSSLSQEQRRQAEDAFANRDDCVIVATSVLELGIDVGNLDRVIQIDSPTTGPEVLRVPAASPRPSLPGDAPSRPSCFVAALGNGGPVRFDSRGGDPD